MLPFWILTNFDWLIYDDMEFVLFLEGEFWIEISSSVMKMEEDNKRQGKLKSPTREEELVVELNSNILKTIQSMQADLQIFKDDSMHEI